MPVFWDPSVCWISILSGRAFVFSALGRFRLLLAFLACLWEFFTGCLKSAEKPCRSSAKHSVLAPEHGVDFRKHGHKFSWMLCQVANWLRYQDTMAVFEHTSHRSSWGETIRTHTAFPLLRDAHKPQAFFVAFSSAGSHIHLQLFTHTNIYLLSSNSGINFIFPSNVVLFWKTLIVFSFKSTLYDHFVGSLDLIYFIDKHLKIYTKQA